MVTFLSFFTLISLYRNDYISVSSNFTLGIPTVRGLLQFQLQQYFIRTILQLEALKSIFGTLKSLLRVRVRSFSTSNCQPISIKTRSRPPSPPQKKTQCKTSPYISKTKVHDMYPSLTNALSRIFLLLLILALVGELQLELMNYAYISKQRVYMVSKLFLPQQFQACR